MDFFKVVPFVKSAERARTHSSRTLWKMRELHVFSVKTGMQSFVKSLTGAFWKIKASSKEGMITKESPVH
jgi:hypothetical protein